MDPGPLEGRRKSRSRFVPSAEFTPDPCPTCTAHGPGPSSGTRSATTVPWTYPLFIAHLSGGTLTCWPRRRRSARSDPRGPGHAHRGGPQARLHPSSRTWAPSRAGPGTAPTWSAPAARTSSLHRVQRPEVRIVPGPNAEVKITDDRQVTPDTVHGLRPVFSRSACRRRTIFGKVDITYRRRIGDNHIRIVRAATMQPRDLTIMTSHTAASFDSTFAALHATRADVEIPLRSATTPWTWTPAGPPRTAASRDAAPFLRAGRGPGATP